MSLHIDQSVSCPSYPKFWRNSYTKGYTKTHTQPGVDPHQFGFRKANSTTQRHRLTDIISVRR